MTSKHIPLVDGFCPECAHEAHLDVLAAQPVDEARYEQLAEHLYTEHGIKPHPYRRGNELWNSGMAEAVHRHIHAAFNPEAEQGQEWWDHDVSDLGGLPRFCAACGVEVVNDGSGKFVGTDGSTTHPMLHVTQLFYNEYTSRK